MSCAIRTPPVQSCKTAPPWGGTITQYYSPKWIDHTYCTCRKSRCDNGRGDGRWTALEFLLLEGGLVTERGFRVVTIGL
jgi:hypothetical protein